MNKNSDNADENAKQQEEVKERHESIPKQLNETVNSGLPKHFLDNYIIVDVLGKSEATLYKLQDTVTKGFSVLRVVKSKDLNEDDRKDIANRINNKIFTNELNHPNIIKFKEWWKDSLNCYFLSEFIEGNELLDYVQDMNYTEKNIIDIIKKLVSASIYLLNAAEFQFTDLKPHSIFVNRKNNAQHVNFILRKLANFIPLILGKINRLRL